jgi:hypothetical protein
MQTIEIIALGVNKSIFALEGKSMYPEKHPNKKHDVYII